MNLKEYIEKNINSTDIMENEELGTQCVGLIKDYSEKVLNIKLWTFWGSARSWYKNLNNIFKKELFLKVWNNKKDLNQNPPVGAILFFNTWKYWHASICIENFKGENKIKVFEQNVWNWDWKKYDDRAKISIITYKNILGWYIKKQPENKNNDLLEEIKTLKLQNKLIIRENAMLLKVANSIDEVLIENWKLEDENEILKEIARKNKAYLEKIKKVNSFEKHIFNTSKLKLNDIPDFTQEDRKNLTKMVLAFKWNWISGINKDFLDKKQFLKSADDIRDRIEKKFYLWWKINWDNQKAIKEALKNYSRALSIRI